MTGSDRNSPAPSGSATRSDKSLPTSLRSPTPAATLERLRRMSPSGMLPLDVSLIAATLDPDAPESARDLVETHLLVLEESGFLSMTKGDHSWWIVLSPPPAPPAPRGGLKSSMAIGREEREEVSGERARQRARERLRREDELATQRWTSEDDGQITRPKRPAVLDAPPIGCPDHPNGSVTGACGPCGTQRERRVEYLARERYQEQLELFEKGQAFDDDWSH